nr:hypothetical protein [uncultured Dyadobacter sp.]
MDIFYFPDSPFEVQLCFGQVIRDLEKTANDPSNPLAAQQRALLEKAAQFPELRQGITNVSQVTGNAELISRLLAPYFPEALTKNEIKAIGLPYSGFLFNHSERFRTILDTAGPDFDFSIRDFSEHQFYVMSCCLILQEHYNVRIDFTKPFFYDIPAANGITRHYRVLYNADFLDIIATENSLPINAEDIDLLIDNYDDLELWKSKFPPNSWLIQGFGIMSLIDVTVETAASLLKEKLLGIRSPGFRQSINSIFRSIYRIPDIEVGFTVFNQEEGRFSPDTFGQQLPSFILREHKHEDVRTMLCPDSYQTLIDKKVFFIISNAADYLHANPGNMLARNFTSQQIGSFILAPVVKNDFLYGIMEVVSPNPKALNSINARKLEVVLPFLTDTIERLASELQNQIQAVIQEKFTTIHNSVYWKFNAEARKLIHYRQLGEDYELNEVTFPEVHPMYGQIDVKGSSEARNTSVQQDLNRQLNAAMTLLETIDRQPLFTDLFQEDRRQLSTYLTDLSIPLRASTEQYVSSFLENRVHPKLREIGDPEPARLIREYLNASDKATGAFHHARRKYEKTISMINEAMARIIDDGQAEAQEIFPHYFERFKSDGIEHNLYVGASISPGRHFHLGKLHALRLWQIRTLCEMEVAHHEMKPFLPYPLEVTTLILVYHAAIDIQFRMDEKRFDVYGSYNARYEIVKKRIDKAFVRGLNERIVQSGKLVIVYSNPAVEREYEGYIRLLRAENRVAGDIENLEVEDLQGISGLKALRIALFRP